MTKNGVSTTTKLGSEQFENYTSRIGRKPKRLCAYDYRHTNGDLFSCVKKTLKDCRDSRDLWLNRKEEIKNKF